MHRRYLYLRNKGNFLSANHVDGFDHGYTWRITPFVQLRISFISEREEKELCLLLEVKRILVLSQREVS